MALYKELKSSIDRFNIEEFCNETTEHIYSYIDHKLTNSVISVNSEADIENLGIDDEFIEILGVAVEKITIPVKPGRNLAVILEIAARNNRLKRMGYNAAQTFNENLMKRLSEEG